MAAGTWSQQEKQQWMSQSGCEKDRKLQTYTKNRTQLKRNRQCILSQQQGRSGFHIYHGHSSSMLAILESGVGSSLMWDVHCSPVPWSLLEQHHGHCALDSNGIFPPLVTTEKHPHVFLWKAKTISVTKIDWKAYGMYIGTLFLTTKASRRQNGF